MTLCSTICVFIDSVSGAMAMSFDRQYGSVLRGCGVQQRAQSNQNVGSHSEHKLEVHSGNAPEFGLSDGADLFGPAKAFFDAFSRVLTDVVSRVSCRADLDGRRTASAVEILRHMRRGI